jgi:hypothetical protein
MPRRIRAHRFLERLRTREVPEQRLRALDREQHAIVSSDRRSFAQLTHASRPGSPGNSSSAWPKAKASALDKLRGLAEWLGMTDAELHAHEPHPGAQVYPAFVAWLALNGSRADVVLAFLANLASWGENCGKVAAALRGTYGAGEDAVAFFDFFANPPADFEPRALAVLDEGLAAGDSPVLASPREPAAAGLRALLLGRARRGAVIVHRAQEPRDHEQCRSAVLTAGRALAAPPGSA